VESNKKLDTENKILASKLTDLSFQFNKLVEKMESDERLKTPKGLPTVLNKETKIKHSVFSSKATSFISWITVLKMKMDIAGLHNDAKKHLDDQTLQWLSCSDFLDKPFDDLVESLSCSLDLTRE